MKRVKVEIIDPLFGWNSILIWGRICPNPSPLQKKIEQPLAFTSPSIRGPRRPGYWTVCLRIINISPVYPDTIKCRLIYPNKFMLTQGWCHIFTSKERKNFEIAQHRLIVTAERIANLLTV